MDFVQLHSFTTVVECGSFACAAQKLHMAHSTVTGHIQRLEQELNCTLIKRSTRTMTVTDKGQAVYRFAKHALGGQAELLADLKRLDGCQRINLAATSCISYGVIPRLLAKYRKKKPDVFFNLMQGQDKEILSMLSSGLISLGFVRKPCQHPDVESVLLGKSPYKLLLPSGGDFSDITAIGADPAELATRLPFILASKCEDSRTRIERRWEGRFGADQSLPPPAVEVCGTENIVNHIRSGLGFCLLPNFVASGLSQDPDFRVLNVEKEKLNPAEVFLVYRQSEADGAVLDLISFIRNWARLNQRREDIAFYE